MKKTFTAGLLAALIMGITLPASAATYTSANVPLSIYDNHDTRSTLSITDHGTITDLNIFLSLNHTFDSDLLISLIAPNSTSIVLSNHRGGGYDNFANTVFDDEAAVAIAAGSAPFTGSFRPDGSLSTFDGLDIFGTWTLSVNDTVGWDGGSLYRWGVDATTSGSVPEPMSAALLGMGLLAAAATRRKQKQV